MLLTSEWVVKKTLSRIANQIAQESKEQKLRTWIMKCYMGLASHESKDESTLDNETSTKVNLSDSDLVWAKALSDSISPKCQSLPDFLDAIDFALDEVSRRIEFGLACSCIPEEV